MKKAILAALIALVAMSSLALAAPAAKPAAKVAAPAADNPSKLAIGATQGFASVKYQFTEEITGTLGLNNFSGNLFAAATGILVKAEYNLAKSGQVQPNVGLYYTTNGAAAATTTLGITYGLSTMVQANFSLGVDFLLLTSTTTAGVSGTGILSGINLAAAYYL